MTRTQRFLWLTALAAVSVLYFPLNRLLTDGYNLKTALDAYIPIIPEFVIPYLLFLPFWAGAFLWAAMKMEETLFRALMTASIFATSIATLIYFVFPTYTERPLIEATDWAARFLQTLYSHDEVFNAFPSGHVLYTTLIALFGSLWKPRWSLWLHGSVALVIASTLFTGQHHLLDPIGGLALGWGSYRLGLWMEYGWKPAWAT
ncbi:MAG: phosphatase PAP2 family protein [Anaerolineales bacterium]|nr:phosphatase PAP2 family protein [Anaerolineales bacterium]MCX7754838.1 phosphatase PAP2 family protein [Anaerolineales bacterium]MDW8277787.1 phosphatase PAP2 family protein [Anaerolineales bacterium]